MPNTNELTLILITGHPATGKTTLANQLGDYFKLPTFCKDAGKEILFDYIGTGDRTWGQKLGVASFELLYWQAEVLLKAGVSCIIEGNFAPAYANASWQKLQVTYPFHCIQLLCSAEPAVVMQRYQQRIDDGSRHKGHRAASVSKELNELIRSNRDMWIDLNGDRIAVDTTHFGEGERAQLQQKIAEKLGRAI